MFRDSLCREAGPDDEVVVPNGLEPGGGNWAETGGMQILHEVGLSAGLLR